MAWRTWNPQFLMLSYHLNNKIKELKHGLQDLASVKLKISGKIYDKEEQIFYEIYPDLICLDYVNFN